MAGLMHTPAWAMLGFTGMQWAAVAGLVILLVVFFVLRKRGGG